VPPAHAHARADAHARARARGRSLCRAADDPYAELERSARSAQVLADAGRAPNEKRLIHASTLDTVSSPNP